MTDARDKTPIEILMVDDNAGDADLMRAAARKTKLVNHLTVATDGVEALAMLRRQGVHADRVRPCLIMLDLNLPKLSGHEVLAEIKGDPQLKHIPVVIISSSRSQDDVIKSYNLHANCFVGKPSSLAEYKSCMAAIEDFWLKVVELPRGA